MHSVISYCWQNTPNKRDLLTYAVLCLLAMACSVALPYVTGIVINNLVDTSMDLAAFGRLCALLTVVYVFQAFCWYVSSLLYTHIEADTSYSIERHATSHIQHLPVVFFEGYDPAWWRRRLDDDANGLAMWFMNAVTGILEHGGLLVSALVVLLFISPVLFLASLVLATISTIIVTAFKMSLHDTSSAFAQSMSDYSSAALRQLSFVQFIRRNALFQKSLDKLDGAFARVRKNMYDANKAGAQASLAYNLVVGLSTSVVVFVSVIEVLGGHMEPGYVATAIGYFGSISASVQSLFGVCGKDFQDAKVHYERMAELESLETEPVGEKTAGPVHAVELAQVSQHWPGKSEPTFNGVNAVFKRGIIYGIAGTNGCGKTTLLRAIAGELRGTVQGMVSIGDESLDNLNQYDLRRHTMGFVDQHPVILPGTLWENLILLAGPAVDEKRVMALCEDIGLGNVLNNPCGMNLILDDAHPALSGGEQQKVSIVRVMLKNPEVLLLDEPSSALDAESRGKLARLLQRDKSSRITIVVTHDDMLLDACDEIVEL